MSNLLLITDVARLRKIFGRLTDDKNIRLRVVNNLEKGGEELSIEKPDVVFVQTHLSGLSADILLMHLKKQLGRKRSRFVLLASPAQTNETILKSYQGWLDTSAEDSQLFSELQHLLVALLNKPKKSEEPAQPEPPASTEFTPQPIGPAESLTHHHMISNQEPAPPQQAIAAEQLPVTTKGSPEPTLEDQGITYSPRQRLSVYSEFTSSFDNAVSSTPEPAPLEPVSPPPAHNWHAESADTVESTPLRSKRGTFLLWLVPVVIAVVVITYMQQKPPSKPQQIETKSAPAATAKPPVPAVPAPVATAKTTPTIIATVPPATSQDQDRMSDKAVLSAIAENRTSKTPASAPSDERPTNLPDFIPRYGLDKQYGIANPGWERYKGRVTEFKVLREAQKIKAIQVIDRGGQGVPESFMRGVLKQVTKNPILNSETSEKKEGYEIQRGKISDNIKVVYYRDENGGKLRAFVLTWQ